MPQAVFLSYASQDADAARRICETLRAEGLEVWFDQSELRGGDAWDASIRRQIKDCALFVPVISANTDSRPEGYFRLEWKLAVDRSHLMADDQPFLLPVLIDDTHEPEARVPDRFRERQWSHVVDRPSADAFAQRVRQLAEAPPRAVPKRPSPPTASAEPATPVKPIKPVATPKAPSAGGGDPSAANRTRVIAAVAASVVIATAAGAWFVVDHNRKQAFIAQGMTNIESLARSMKHMEAFRLAGDVERAGGAALLTEAIRESYSRAIDVTSSPQGAAIAFREYRPRGDEPAWIELGAAPLAKVRVPRAILEWRATLPQRVTHTLVTDAQGSAAPAFSLPAADAKDAGMLPVPEGKVSVGTILGLGVAQGVSLKAFSVDRTEVTNRQYARFVQAGGYAREEFWKHPFQEGAKNLGFREAMARFKDSTGRPGPAHWKLGSFPDGEGDLPVRGISWHEASAYAAFAGKALPTIYHWYFADSGGDFLRLPSAVLIGANFESQGPRAATASRAIGRFGAIDMAGNVREWIATPTDKGRRIAVGGSWQEVGYEYKHGSPLSAFDRPADVGFRCMSAVDAAAADIAFAPLAERPWRDATAIAPVSDSEYAIYARLLSQKLVPPDARVEATDASKPHWTRLKINLAAGHGDERMDAYLYLPKGVAPPFQTVIFMPGSTVFGNRKPFEEVGENATGWAYAEMLIRGGRAVFYPIWNGSFERSGATRWTRASLRERVLKWVGEFRQSVEFLRSRSEVDAERIGFYGISLGAEWAPNMLAIEPRVRAAVLLAGGLWGAYPDGERLSPEIDMATYAPRTRTPVLMLNGRNDLVFPYETSQVPLFNLLGSPPGKKKHKTYPGGHSALGWYDDVVKESHDWFDAHFGPVVAGTGK